MHFCYYIYIYKSGTTARRALPATTLALVATIVQLTLRAIMRARRAITALRT
jgi:hypothetical protein